MILFPPIWKLLILSGHHYCIMFHICGYLMIRDMISKILSVAGVILWPCYYIIVWYCTVPFLLSIGRALFLFLSSFFFSTRSDTSCTSCCNKTWFVAFTFISFDKNYSGCLQWNEDFLCIKLYDVHKNENSNLILWFDILSIAFAE